MRKSKKNRNVNARKRRILSSDSSNSEEKKDLNLPPRRTESSDCTADENLPKQPKRIIEKKTGNGRKSTTRRIINCETSSKKYNRRSREHESDNDNFRDTKLFQNVYILLERLTEENWYYKDFLLRLENFSTPRKSEESSQPISDKETQISSCTRKMLINSNLMNTNKLSNKHKKISFVYRNSVNLKIINSKHPIFKNAQLFKGVDPDYNNRNKKNVMKCIPHISESLENNCHIKLERVSTSSDERSFENILSQDLNISSSPEKRTPRKKIVFDLDDDNSNSSKGSTQNKKFLSTTSTARVRTNSRSSCGSIENQTNELLKSLNFELNHIKQTDSQPVSRLQSPKREKLDFSNKYFDQYINFENTDKIQSTAMDEIFSDFENDNENSRDTVSKLSSAGSHRSNNSVSENSSDAGQKVKHTFKFLESTAKIPPSKRKDTADIRKHNFDNLDHRNMDDRSIGQKFDARMIIERKAEIRNKSTPERINEVLSSPKRNVTHQLVQETPSFKMPSIPTYKNSPKTPIIKPQNSKQWQYNKSPYSFTSKDDDVISLYAESLNLDYTQDLDISQNAVQNWIENQTLPDNLPIKNTEDIPENPEETIDNEIPENSQNIIIDYQNMTIEKLFQYLCPKFRSFGLCRYKDCYGEHSFPTGWEEIFKNTSLNEVLKFYNEIKVKSTDTFLYKQIFPTVVNRLESAAMIPNMLDLVMDIMEKDLFEDKSGFILIVIKALENMGLTPKYSIPMIFEKSSFKDGQSGLKNSLSDILLGIFTEKITELNNNWYVIKILTEKRKNIDPGTVQEIITLGLKEPLNKIVLQNIYQDILVTLEKNELDQIFDTIIQKYLAALKSFNLENEVQNLILKKNGPSSKIIEKKNTNILPRDPRPAVNSQNSIPNIQNKESTSHELNFVADTLKLETNSSNIAEKEPNFRPNNDLEMIEPNYDSGEPKFRQNEPNFRLNEPYFRSNDRQNDPNIRLNEPYFRSNDRQNDPNIRLNESYFRSNDSRSKFGPNTSNIPQLIKNLDQKEPNTPKYGSNASDFGTKVPNFTPNNDNRQNWTKSNSMHKNFERHGSKNTFNETNFRCSSLNLRLNYSGQNYSDILNRESTNYEPNNANSGSNVSNSVRRNSAPKSPDFGTNAPNCDSNAPNFVPKGNYRSNSHYNFPNSSQSYQRNAQNSSNYDAKLPNVPNFRYNAPKLGPNPPNFYNQDISKPLHFSFPPQTSGILGSRPPLMDNWRPPFNPRLPQGNFSRMPNNRRNPNIGQSRNYESNCQNEPFSQDKQGKGSENLNKPTSDKPETIVLGQNIDTMDNQSSPCSSTDLNFAISKDITSQTFLNNLEKNTKLFKNLKEKDNSEKNLNTKIDNERIKNQTATKEKLNYEKITNSYSRENSREVIQGIIELDDNFRKKYFEIVLDTLIKNNHNIPTFFQNICATYVVYEKVGNMNNKVKSTLMCLGMNLMVHFAQQKQHNIGYKIFTTMQQYFGNQKGYEREEVYIGNKSFSISKKVLIICDTLLQDFREVHTVWNNLTVYSNMLLKISYWMLPYEESDIVYRNEVFENFMNVLKSIRKTSKYALKYLIDIVKLENCDVDISKYFNEFLNVDPDVDHTFLENLNRFHPNWAEEVDPLIFRAVNVILFIKRSVECRPVFHIGQELEIYPQFSGEESILELERNLSHEEIDMILSLFLGKRKLLNIMNPLKILIKDHTLQSVQYPKILSTPISKKDMLIRIANVCKQKLKINYQIDAKNEMILFNSNFLIEYFNNHFL